MALAALHAGGGNASNKQMDTWRQLFDVNSRQFGEAADLVLLQDVFMGGTATMSASLNVEFQRSGQHWFRLPFNAFGGIVRWCRGPDMATFACTSTLGIEVTQGGKHLDDPPFKGNVMYMDKDLVQHTDPIENFIVKAPVFAPPPGHLIQPVVGCTCPACIYSQTLAMAAAP